MYVNQHAENLSGYSRDELLSMNPWVLVDPEFRAMGEQRTNARLRGENPEPRYTLEGYPTLIILASSLFHRDE